MLKHAAAHRVQISLHCRGRCLDIDVTDDPVLIADDQELVRAGSG